VAVYIVSGDAEVRDSLTKLVTEAGLCPRVLPALEAWTEVAAPEPRGCLVLDAGVNELAGPERLARFASVCARIPVVVLTGRGDIATAVHAIRQGAAYVQQKPYHRETLLECIHQAVTSQYDRNATV
jgi:two-component system, LuxR family, response regulator FixJ